jgi:sigma-B regulation protein RsbU (phosphoserine phosphatase)
MQNLPNVEIRLQLKELELQSLLEITSAINENAEENHLYKMFKFTLRSDKHIGKLALFVFDEIWSCKAFFGTEQNYNNITLPESILIQHEPCQTKEVAAILPPFDEFQQLLPVKHKTNLLAYVLLSPAHENSLLDTDFVEALTNIIIVAIENKKLARKQQQQEFYKAQLALARNVQTLLFPKKLPYTQTLKVVADYLPHQSVGGDYYDYIAINPDKFLLCIADVSGKGVPAALLMSNFQAALRILVRQNLSLEKIIQELNYLVYQNTQGESFVTVFLVEYDIKSQQLAYINAGHNPSILFANQDKKPMMLKNGTTILGSFKKLPFLELTELDKIESFLLFTFTDGLTETANQAGEEFGMENLETFLIENRQTDLQVLHKKMIEQINIFRGEMPYPDDITLLSCSVEKQ